MKAPMMVPVSCPPIDRDDLAQFTPASGREPLSGLRFGKARQFSRRTAAQIVDPVVGVRHETHLRDPWPQRIGGRFNTHAPPGLQGGRSDAVVTRVGAQGLAVAYAHRSPTTCPSSAGTSRGKAQSRKYPPITAPAQRPR